MSFFLGFLTGLFVAGLLAYLAFLFFKKTWVLWMLVNIDDFRV